MSEKDTVAAVGRVVAWTESDRDRELVKAEAVFQSWAISEWVTSETYRPASLKAGDVLLVAEMNRLTQSIDTMAEILKELKVRGVRLICVKNGLDTGTKPGETTVETLLHFHSVYHGTVAHRTPEGGWAERPDDEVVA